MIRTTGPLTLPGGLITGRDQARELRRRLEWVVSPDDLWLSNLRECGQGLGPHHGRRRYDFDGRPIGGKKVCTSAHGCPVHSPMVARDHIRAATWFAQQHAAAGLPMVSYLIAPPHRWPSAEGAFRMVEDTVREVIRAGSGGGRTRVGLNGVTTYKSRVAPHAKKFKRYKPVGWIAFIHMPLSPVNGWHGHAHIHGFLRDLPDGIEGFQTQIAAAVREEISTRVTSQQPMWDGFYTGGEDQDGRRAMMINTADEDGYPVWMYYALADPQHPDNPGSAFYEAKADLAADRAHDHFDYRPYERPRFDDGELWGRAPVGHDPALWSPDDRVWQATIEEWHNRFAATGSAPDLLELIRDIGGAFLAGSETAGLLYREALLATARGKRCIISRGLYRAYPPPPEVTDWTLTADRQTSVLVTNSVCAAVDYAARGTLGRDPMRIVEGLIGDGDLELAVSVLRQYAGPNVHLVEDRDGTPLIQFGRKVDR